MFLLLACGIQGGAEKGDQAEPPIWDGDGETDTETDTDTDTDADTDADLSDCPTAEVPTCSFGVLVTSPGENGLANVLDPVSVVLDGEDPGAWMTIEGVAGSSTVDGAAVTFTPDQPLDASAGYTARACWCGGEYSFDFGTRRADAVPVPEELQGRTWALPLSDGFMSSPPTLGSVLEDLQIALLVQATEADEAALHLRLAWSDQYTADLSQASGWSTLDVEVPFAQNPALRAEGDEWEVQGLTEAPAQDVRFDAAIDADGGGVHDAMLSMLVDASEWSLAVGADDPDEMCDVLATWGDACEPCSDANPYCLRFTWELLEGEEVDLDLARIP